MNDLEKRTLLFSRSPIDLCNSVKQNTIDMVLIRQLMRSATSIGANLKSPMKLKRLEIKNMDFKYVGRNQKRLYICWDYYLITALIKLMLSNFLLTNHRNY